MLKKQKLNEQIGRTKMTEPAPTPMTAEERELAAIHVIRADYRSAVRSAETAKSWLRRDLDERTPGESFTPGNIAASAGKLEAALEKAYALRETLKVLGVEP